jgi:hypothetical protein
MPQDQLDRIRSLELSSSFKAWCLYARQDVPYNADHYGNRWEEAWTVVAGMKGLKPLRVELRAGSRLDYQEGGVEERILGPLRAVRQVEDYKVAVNWREVQGFVLGEAPFELVRELT